MARFVMFYDITFIGNLVKDERKKRGITQLALSQESGISRATINALENMKANDVNVNTLASIFGAMHNQTKKSFNYDEFAVESAPNFDFPYIWSSKKPNKNLLIIKVLERCIFRDVALLCAHYGTLEVCRVLYASNLVGDSLLMQSLTRMIRNIQKGFANA